MKSSYQAVTKRLNSQRRTGKWGYYKRPSYLPVFGNVLLGAFTWFPNCEMSWLLSGKHKKKIYVFCLKKGVINPLGRIPRWNNKGNYASTDIKGELTPTSVGSACSHPTSCIAEIFGGFKRRECAEHRTGFFLFGIP